ncbi:type I-F CRISPR-associated protein Csy1 [Methylomicrobium sp. Wu6]|uniref:type I-F CRISPR-associated protein Csy1 n=1 Tax=Methylomicrobium sp. Wu6 TaxID=3107928 RepID=UPI002DD625F2|nr:type I-F CRISPR-associated protein Csy1 [Methylomicrobium sp. Wu6]MEC4748223.1 type I-F CRISPR-associated protein Csy1 [Methylomicrobium sp. Wu6]
MNPNISAFFAERKATWLKTRMKASLTADEQSALNDEAENKFSRAIWLPDAAKRASWLSIVSHPSKFSHPSAKTTSIIANGRAANDGYLRTGNVDYELDVFGNAAAMDVYKFLMLPMDDGQTVLQHLERDSAEIRALLSVPTASYESLKQGLISIKQSDFVNKTDQLVKQVYFPVDDSYHLLSLLTPSGLLTKLKTHIDALRFSETTKQAKESRRKNEHHEQGYDDVLDLTITGYGGTQPQNVSVLNSQNAGRAYLLPSTPPPLQKRQIRLPTRNFFRNTLRLRQFEDSFQTMDRLIRSGVNNIHVREGIRNTLKYLIDQVLQQAFQIRATGPGWSEKEHYRSLPSAQRIWLDDALLEQRQNQGEWLDEITLNFANWILNSHEYLHKETRVKLGDDELREVRSIVELAVGSDKEFFK